MADDQEMRLISATEAQKHIHRLLEDVERGETLLITRNGRVIARIEPEPSVAMPADVETDSSAAAS